MDPYQQAKYWLDVVDYCSSAGFKPVKDDQFKQEQAWADSVKWSFDFFAPGANPCVRENKEPCNVHVAEKIGADILRQAYRMDPLTVEVLESVAFTVIRFDSQQEKLLDLPPEERKKAFATRAAVLLSEKAQIRPGCFALPDNQELGDGILMSTNEKADPNVMFYWPDRIDAGIRAAKPFVLLYKKSVGRVGYPPLIGWFSKQLQTSP